MTAPWTPRERAMWAALEATPCRCSKAIKNACPVCGETLVAVRYNGYLNADRWDAIKGGDWYCNTCIDQSIVNGKKHWHDRDLQTVTYQQCGRCAALTDPPPPDPRDEARKVAEEALGTASGAFNAYAVHHAVKDDDVKRAKNQCLRDHMDAAIDAISAAKGEK